MATHQLSITLPENILRLIQDKVASGEYSSPSEVVAGSVSRLQEDVPNFAQWLRTEMPLGIAEADAHLKSLLTVEQMHQGVTENLEDMAATNELKITLPTETMRIIEAKVASGKYTSASDVVNEGISSLDFMDTESEEWLRMEIPLLCAEADAHPERLYSVDDAYAAVDREIARTQDVE